MLIQAVLIPLTASAHEVYVLDSQQIADAISTPSPNPFSAIPTEGKLFLIWALITTVAFLLVLTASISPLFERVCDPFLLRLKKYAPLAGRLTFGISLFASGYFGSLFGPELPLSAIASPSVVHVLGIIFMIAGISICLGFLTRIITLLGICLFVYAASIYHWYMFTYLSYLGEMILFFILGGGTWSLDRAIPALVSVENIFRHAGTFLAKHSFLIMRILFGITIVFSSIYSKFIHSNLALQTIEQYHLTQYFHFSPMFLVMGACIIEILIGICIAVGFEIRFMTLVFTVFLTMSLIFFGEVVWPHLILFGVNITLFLHGYDEYTLEKVLFEKTRRGEPVL